MSNKIKVISFDGNSNNSEIKTLIEEQFLLIDNENGTVTSISDILNDSTYTYTVMIAYIV